MKSNTLLRIPSLSSFTSRLLGDWLAKHQKNINFPPPNSVWLLCCIIIIIILATQMQGCKVNLKLEEKVLLGREEDRRDLSLVCKRSLLFAGWLGTGWWPSTCPPWPPTPRSRSPRSSSWPPTPWCATATWTTSPGCGNLPRQVRQPVPLFLPEWCLSKE